MPPPLRMPCLAPPSPAPPLTFGEAWIGALAYTFQLYFDFSGYSDMAIGLARMVGIRFPMNFDSPYKSVNIVDFWRRWHITLSRFLRDYLYIPLGGNRKGPIRRYLNLFLTMLLGGLWHGAGWTFVVWGGLHGIYLMVNHGWQAIKKALGFDRPSLIGRGLARVVTFGCVVIAWVFFRAESFGAATSVLKSMFLGTGISFPKNYDAKHHVPEALVKLAGIRFDGSFHNALMDPSRHSVGGHPRPDRLAGAEHATDHGAVPARAWILDRRNRDVLVSVAALAAELSVERDCGAHRRRGTGESVDRLQC